MNDKPETSLVEHQNSSILKSQQQPQSPIQIVKELTSAGVSMEDLKQMLTLQKEYEKNEAKKAFHLALAGFKSEDILIVKDKTVSFETSGGGVTSYCHASLGNIVKIAVPFMSNHGLSHRWEVEQKEARVFVTCILTHRLGHSEKVTMEASPDSSGKKNAIQQVSSTVTYLERYTFLAITGLAVEDMNDDDGAGFTVNSELEKAQESEKTLLPFYPDEFFEENKSKWKALILDGKSSPQHTINMLESRFTLTDKQKKEIEELNNADS